MTNTSTMKEVSISVPFNQIEKVVNFLQDELKISSLQLITGANCSIIQTYISLSQEDNLNQRLAEIGCGVMYGLIVTREVNSVKPVPKEPSVTGLVRVQHLSTEELHTTISSNNLLTINYLIMMTVSSSIAGLGLLSDNNVMIVASMLLSPLMNPLLAMSFGTVIRDWTMFFQGVKNGLIGTTIAFGIGCLISFCYWWWSDDYYEWPTFEMESRSEDQALLLGVVFALLSGVGVGVSVSEGGINTLVGVAIAAALLPPIVNTGLQLMYAFLTTEWFFAELAGYSFTLFSLNIVLIYVVAGLMLRFSGVAYFRRRSTMWKGFPKITFQQEEESISTLPDEMNLTVRDLRIDTGSSPSVAQSEVSGVDKIQELFQPKMDYDTIQEFTEEEIKTHYQKNPRLQHLMRVGLLRWRNVRRAKEIREVLRKRWWIRSYLQFFLRHWIQVRQAEKLSSE